MNTHKIDRMKKIIIFFLLSACSQLPKGQDQDRVVVSYKGPLPACEFLGQDEVESSHFEKLENQELTDTLIGDLVTSKCAKNANYIHVTKVADQLLSRSVSSEEAKNKKELHRTKVEGHFYHCPVSTN